MKGKAKRTDLMAVELRVIASTFEDEHRANVLLSAADRLEELEKIAAFYCREANGFARKVYKKHTKAGAV